MYSLFQQRTFPFTTDDHMLQNRVGHSSHNETDPISCHRIFRKMSRSYPFCSDRHQRKPEQQMKISPENTSVDLFYCLKEVMMIVPVDSYINKTENISENSWDERLENGPAAPFRNLRFKN